MHTLRGLATAEPYVTLSAADTKAFLSASLSGRHTQGFEQLVDASQIRHRYSIASYDELFRLTTIEARNALYVAHAVPLGERAARAALHAAGITPTDVDLLIVTSSTGFIVPTLDQHLAMRLGLRSGVRFLFLSGLGCAGAVRAIGLAVDLMGGSSSHALVVSVELPSPWLQLAEPSREDIENSIMFGDGAAAIVVGPPGPACEMELIASHAEMWPRGLGARGSALTDTGFRHFSYPRLLHLLRTHLCRTVDGFLSTQGIDAAELSFYAVNPSDHRLLQAVSSILAVPRRNMEPTWAAWGQHGNTLSAGPLYVLSMLRHVTPPEHGQLGLVVAVGPGSTCDLALLRWQREKPD
jgi:alkylresorcinol/alkylpyrone synthase